MCTEAALLNDNETIFNVIISSSSGRMFANNIFGAGNCERRQAMCWAENFVRQAVLPYAMDARSADGDDDYYE